MSFDVVLVATYELGHQPFGVASPAAWLRRAGARVSTVDLSRQKLDEAAVRSARLVAFHVPMHTATRMAVRVLPKVRALQPDAHVCFYGLYAPVNEPYLRKLGVDSVIGGEFEEPLCRLAEDLRDGRAARGDAPAVSLAKLDFIPPDRAGMPPPAKYAHLATAQGNRVAGYTEASRGCKHLCRHCPIVPVYEGRFRIVQRDVVLEDVRQQVAAGARHITFGDPDFWNGIGHAAPLVQAFHQEFPEVTYDATIKVEHLLRHADALPTLVETGCVLVTTAVESVDDAVLERLDKGHTRADFHRVVARCREVGLALAPTFVPFNPWTTLEGYVDLLDVLARLGLVDHVAPVQLAIRLLLPAGTRLLELEEVRTLVDGRFDEAALTYRWAHADPRVDALCGEVQAIAGRADRDGTSRGEAFAQIHALAHRALGREAPPLPAPTEAATAVPRLSENWYCCAEPTEEQFALL